MKKFILVIGFSFLTATAVANAENKGSSGVIRFSGSIVEAPCQISNAEGNSEGNYNISCYKTELKDIEKKSFNIINTKNTLKDDRYVAKSVKIKENLYRIDINYH